MMNLHSQEQRKRLGEMKKKSYLLKIAKNKLRAELKNLIQISKCFKINYQCPQGCLAIVSERTTPATGDLGISNS
jgi:hypothetical protein